MPIVCADAHVAAFVEEAIERRHSRGARGEENYKNVLDGSDELVDRRHNDGRRSVAGGCTAFGKITEAAPHEGTRIQSRLSQTGKPTAVAAPLRHHRLSTPTWETCKKETGNATYSDEA